MMFSINHEELKQKSGPIRGSVVSGDFIPHHLQPDLTMQLAMELSLHLMYPGARIFTHGDDWIVLKHTKVQK